jgi:hypothetical protein
MRERGILVKEGAKGNYQDIDQYIKKLPSGSVM